MINFRRECLESEVNVNLMVIAARSIEHRVKEDQLDHQITSEVKLGKSSLTRKLHGWTGSNNKIQLEPDGRRKDSHLSLYIPGNRYNQP